MISSPILTERSLSRSLKHLSCLGMQCWMCLSHWSGCWRVGRLWWHGRRAAARGRRRCRRRCSTCHWWSCRGAGGGAGAAARKSAHRRSRLVVGAPGEQPHYQQERSASCKVSFQCYVYLNSYIIIYCPYLTQPEWKLYSIYLLLMWCLEY